MAVFYSSVVEFTTGCMIRREVLCSLCHPTTSFFSDASCRISFPGQSEDIITLVIEQVAAPVDFYMADTYAWPGGAELSIIRNNMTSFPQHTMTKQRGLRHITTGSDTHPAPHKMIKNLLPFKWQIMQ